VLHRLQLPADRRGEEERGWSDKDQGRDRGERM
jgi:hypothetical protein